VDDLVSELSLYLEVCQREGIDFSNVVKVTQCLPFITEFWDKYKTRLPKWYDFATKCMLLQPSSASVERLFSLLKLVFGDLQASSLQDKVQLQVQLMYNKL